MAVPYHMTLTMPRVIDIAMCHTRDLTRDNKNLNI